MLDSMKKAWKSPDSSTPEAEREDGFRVIDDLSPGASRLIERGGTDIARTIAPASATFEEDYFKLGLTYHRVLYLQTWPNEVAPNWLQPLYSFPRAVDVSIYYKPLPSGPLQKTLKMKFAREQSQLQVDADRGAIQDSARMKNLENAARFLELLQRGDTRPFQVCLLIMIRGQSLQELNDLTIQVEKQMNSVNANLRRADLRQRDAFLSMMPFGRNYIADGYSTRNMQTEAAAYTFPLSNADLSHPKGIWYGINRSTNSNVILDRWKLKSPHAVILGATGTGKSYGMKLEVLRALMRGYPVTIVDPDAECERMCRAVGGQFITVGPASPDRINVLDFSHMGDGVDDQITVKILAVIKLIGSMMNTGRGYGMSPSQVSILQRTIGALYAEYGYTTDARTQLPVWMGGQADPRQMPILSDLLDRLQQQWRDSRHDPGEAGMIREIIVALEPYTSGGMFSSLFDQRTTVNLSEGGLVVFNIKPISDARNPQLTTLAMQSVLDFIWATNMNRQQQFSGIRRMLVVDEAHIMMRHPESAEALESFARQARKVNCALTVLTQDPMDFLRPDRPQGRAIFGNSSLKTLLSMPRNSLELLQELMGLDDVEVDLLYTAGKGEGMLFAETDRVWLSQHTASEEENELITTNPEEVKQIEDRKRKATPALPVTQDELPVSAEDYLSLARYQPRRSTLPEPEEVSQLGPPPKPQLIGTEGGPMPLNEPARDPIPQLPPGTGRSNQSPISSRPRLPGDRTRSRGRAPGR